MKTTEQFIIDAKKIHGNKYDYSLVKYMGAFQKVCIICPIHGEFWQTPHSHLKGAGCKKCSIEKKKELLSSNTEKFIEKAKIIHNDYYDYSKVEYINAYTKVCIICPIHGEFWQTPTHHLNGEGCPKCRYIKSSNKTRKTSKLFIEDAKKIHGDKYDYSKVEYKNRDTKVCIICPKHGEFWQTPANHIQGHGCPICDESHLEADIRVLLNENNIEFIQEYNDKWLNKQFVDFYLPQHNIVIECQGEQHFKPVRFNGINMKVANENYKKMLKLDKEKKNKCQKRGVKLLYYSELKIKYPYKVITDKNKLLKIIKNGKNI